MAGLAFANHGNDGGEGTFPRRAAYHRVTQTRERTMHGIIYIVGLIVVIMAVLSLFGLR